MTAPFITSELNDIPWIYHGFFMRSGGVSTDNYTSLNCSIYGTDDQKHVRTNRDRVAESLGITPANLVFLKQVHGKKVVKVEKPWKLDKEKEADAMVTDKPGIALGILTADCVPVLLADKKQKVIGAAHAGWKGAYGGVIESVVEAMKKLGANPSNIEAIIGPCISFNSYEVRADFKETFVKRSKKCEEFFKDSPREGRFLFNLPGYVEVMLKKTGIKKVSDMQADTLLNEQRFFSCRRGFLRSEKGFGHQASVIVMKE